MAKIRVTGRTKSSTVTSTTQLIEYLVILIGRDLYGFALIDQDRTR
jgi:hypothetical protein